MGVDAIVKSGVDCILERVEADVFRGVKVLITGGAGFLGSWLIDFMVEAGAKVTCIDNFTSGSRDNVKHLMGNSRFRCVVMDVAEAKLNEGYDYIVHMASIASPDSYMQKPVETMLPNSVGLLKILNHARRTGGRVLFTSTSEVYGDAEVLPIPETYWGRVNPVGVRSCYDESKRFGETLCLAFFREYGVDVRVARVFNTYGPRLDVGSSYARVVSRFIVQALRGEPITVHGDGSQTRSFCYVVDVVVGLVKMLVRDGVAGEVINIGSPYEVSILNLAKLIRKLVGSSSPIVFTPSRPDDPKRRVPSILKAQRVLNWSPKVGLEDGLKLTIKWFRDRPL